MLVQGWGEGQGKSVFLNTGVGGGFKSGPFGAYVLYGWPLINNNPYLLFSIHWYTNLCHFLLLISCSNAVQILSIPVQSPIYYNSEYNTICQQWLMSCSNTALFRFKDCPDQLKNIVLFKYYQTSVQLMMSWINIIWAGFEQYLDRSISNLVKNMLMFKNCSNTVTISKVDVDPEALSCIRHGN